ncbi:hypothetical protein LTR94_025616 [Friedmanniomyces endolithicus]|nr:hypothetical protein LTR94_025616 [Friedmanniomyces endolithicus]
MALEAGKGPSKVEMTPHETDGATLMIDAPTLGDGLRRARARSNQTLIELSAVTKVHTRYLTALEQNDWSSLPSRVFAIGYVRAYASALGLDEQLCIERFKKESPDTSTPLKAPIGIAFEDVRKHSPRIIAAVAVVVTAVIGWNVFQRISLMQAPRPSDIAEVPKTWAQDDLANQKTGIDLGAPKAAPPDQTTPALYITPGLEAQLTGVDPNDPAAMAAATAAAQNTPVQKAFNPRGAVYGAPVIGPQVVLQANKAGALVVRTGESQVLFARQMSAGEAWRAPTGVNATIDVSDPAAFDVYLNGEHGGALAAVLTPLSQLNRRAEDAARAVAEEQARRQAQAQIARLARDQAAAQSSAGQATPGSPPPAQAQR